MGATFRMNVDRMELLGLILKSKASERLEANQNGRSSIDYTKEIELTSRLAVEILRDWEYC